MNENLPIDPAQLDEEWLHQPLLFDEAQQEVADCLKIRDGLKDDLESVKADTLLDISKDWEKPEYGLKKAPTAPQVAALILKNTLVVTLTASFNEAQHALNLANNTVRSFEMRKKALEKLTDLHISNYFSVPNPNHELVSGKRVYEAKNQKAEENSKVAVEKLNENKKERVKEVKDKIKNEGVKEALDMVLEKGEKTTLVETPRRSRRKRG